MLSRPARRVVSACAALGLGLGSAGALSACEHQATLVPGHVLGIALMEYRLRPNHIVARSGRTAIFVSNAGRLTHNLVISGPTATATAARVPDLAPGTATTLTVVLTPGRYGLASSVGSDAALGAEGTLTVTAP